MVVFLRNLCNEALDKHECLVFFCLLAGDAGWGARESDICKRKTKVPSLKFDSFCGRIEGVERA